MSGLQGGGGQISKSLDFIGHEGGVLCTKMSHDGRWAFSGSRDGSVHLWDAQTAEIHMILCGHAGWVRSIDISSAGNVFATGSDDYTVRICELIISLFIIKNAHDN